MPVRASLGLGLKSSYVITAHGELFQCGQYHSAVTAERGILTRVQGVGTVRAVACCREDAVLVTASGGVLVARSGVFETPGNHTYSVTQVACGDGHYAAVTNEGGLYLWGAGAAGQLGMGVARYDAQDEVDPEVYDDQLAELNQQAWPVQLPRESLGMLAVQMVACGDRHTVVLADGGCVFTFGSGRHGQLGHGHKRDADRPTLIEMHGDDLAKASSDEDAAVALDTTQIPPSFQAPADTAQIPTDTAQNKTQHPAGIFRVASVAASGDHSMAITSSGSLYAWGSNKNRQLGLSGKSHTAPVFVAIGKNKPVALASVVTSSAHTLAVSTTGMLYVCGGNQHGQLGIGDTQDRRRFKRIRPFTPGKIVEAAAGPSTSAVVTENGELWTWGKGAHGCLGHGGRQDAVAPVRVVAMSVDYPLQAVGAGPSGQLLPVYMQHLWTSQLPHAADEPRPGLAVSMLPPGRGVGNRDADGTAVDSAGLGRWNAAVEPNGRWLSPVAPGGAIRPYQKAQRA